jgi:hypothetical protein
MDIHGTPVFPTLSKVFQIYIIMGHQNRKTKRKDDLGKKRGR